MVSWATRSSSTPNRLIESDAPDTRSSSPSRFVLPPTGRLDRRDEPELETGQLLLTADRSTVARGDFDRGQPTPPVGVRRTEAKVAAIEQHLTRTVRVVQDLALEHLGPASGDDARFRHADLRAEQLG